MLDVNGAAKVRLGETEVGRIGLGTNRLTNTEEHVDFLREAVAAGVELIDTAHTSIGGESEAAIGALAPMPDGCLVATKGGYKPGTGRPEALSAQIEESLRRLRTDTIDLYYLHKPDPETPLEESVGTIDEHRSRGQIRYVGVSNFTVEQIERARGVTPIAAVQNEYNLSQRTHEDVVEYCAENEIVFVPYFPLRAGGGSTVARIAKAHGATAAQIGLAWMLRRSPTMLPIPGTLSLDHLKENLAATRIELRDEEFEAVS